MFQAMTDIKIRKNEENREDNTDIQIEISSVGSSSQSHEQTPAAASPHNENKGVKQRRNRYISEVNRCFAEAVLLNVWDEAQSIYEKSPNTVSTSLNASGETALHVAVRENNSTFVKELVKLMNPQDLEIRNTEGKTAFYMAVLVGNHDFLEIMMEKNQKLPLIPGPNEMFPVHLAASKGYPKIVQNLSYPKLLQKMDDKAIERLFLLTIHSSMYDVAERLLIKYSDKLSTARDDQRLTALHMLARKHSKEFGTKAFYLLQELWSQVILLKDDQIVELITQPSVVLFDAVNSGNEEVVKCLLKMNDELMMRIKDPNNGQNLLHCAAFYRQVHMFNTLLNKETLKHTIQDVDNDGNNVLHFAALQPTESSRLTQPTESSRLTSDIQMKRQLAWFKEVESKVPELKKIKNRYGMTPEDLFFANYENISEEVRDSTIATANSGMVVATLTATVAFGAALTVPGDKNDAGYIVFILSNAVALFCSSASIVSFMVPFGSRFTIDELIMLLHPCVILGRWLLFISITAMVIAFAAVSFLIFDHRYKWVAYVVTSMGLLPIILMLIVLRIPPFNSLFGYFFRSRYSAPSTKVQ